MCAGIGCNREFSSSYGRPKQGKTSREEEVWAAGDCVRGADPIVTAMAPARKAAHSIDRALRARLSKAPNGSRLASPGGTRDETSTGAA